MCNSLPLLVHPRCLSISESRDPCKWNDHEQILGCLARNGFPAVIYDVEMLHLLTNIRASKIPKHHQNLKHRYFFKSTPPPHDLPIVSPPWVPPMPLTQTGNHEPRRSEHTPAQRCNGVKLDWDDSDSGWSFWGQCQSVKVCQAAICLALLAQCLRHAMCMLHWR